MQEKPKGGRGNKAPYRTKTMRIPEPIEYQVEKICDVYRQASLQGNWEGINDEGLLGTTTPLDRLTKEEAIKEANKILKGRKSARISLEKMLQVLYGDKELKL